MKTIIVSLHFTLLFYLSCSDSSSAWLRRGTSTDQNNSKTRLVPNKHGYCASLLPASSFQLKNVYPTSADTLDIMKGTIEQGFYVSKTFHNVLVGKDHMLRLRTSTGVESGPTDSAYVASDISKFAGRLLESDNEGADSESDEGKTTGSTDSLTTSHPAASSALNSSSSMGARSTATTTPSTGRSIGFIVSIILIGILAMASLSNVTIRTMQDYKHDRVGDPEGETDD